LAPQGSDGFDVRQAGESPRPDRLIATGRVPCPPRERSGRETFVLSQVGGRRASPGGLRGSSRGRVGAETRAGRTGSKAEAFEARTAGPRPTPGRGSVLRRSAAPALPRLS